MQFEILYHIPVSLVMLLGLVILGLVIESGYRYGLTVREARASESLLEIIPTSLMGLLALLIGFTFSMSIARFDARKMALAQEVNGIETVWYRAGLIASGEVVPARALLLRYVDHRLRFPKDSASPEEFSFYEAESERLQGALWLIAQRESLRDRSAGGALFADSVNELFDVGTLREFASQDHVPEIAYFVIFALAMSAIFALAYIYGARRHPKGPLFMLAILLILVLGLIQDLDRPSRGLVRVNGKMMTELRDSLGRR